MTPHRLLRLRACVVRIGARWSVVEFADGTRVLAAPDYGPEYVERARSLGYAGTDRQAADAMCREHDALHALLAGDAPCPVLWGVAHPKAACREGLRDEIEAAVLAAAAALNGMPAAVPADTLRAARRLLRGSGSDGGVS